MRTGTAVSPSSRKATRSETVAPVAVATAGTSLPTGGPGLYVEVFPSAYTPLPIPSDAQPAAEAVTQALNYTYAFYNPLQPAPLFQLANGTASFSLLFTGADVSCLILLQTMKSVLAITRALHRHDLRAAKRDGTSSAIVASPSFARQQGQAVPAASETKPCSA